MIKLSERDKTHWLRGISPKMFNILEYFKDNSRGWHKKSDIIKGITKILGKDKVNEVDIQKRHVTLFNPNEFSRIAKELKKLGFLKNQGQQSGSVWAVNDENLLVEFFVFHKMLKQAQGKANIDDGLKKTKKISEEKE